MVKRTYLAMLATVLALVISPAASAKAPTGTIDISSGSQLQFKGLVNFDTTVNGSTKGGVVDVVLSCYQDVDGDGHINTNLLGPDIVYSWVDVPDAQFSFSGQGQSSIWSNRGGGVATCRADLDLYRFTKVETITVLDSTGDFPVSG